MALLVALPYLTRLGLTDCRITDEALVAMGRMPQQRELELSRSTCLDFGMSEVFKQSQPGSFKWCLNEGDGK